MSFSLCVFNYEISKNSFFKGLDVNKKKSTLFLATMSSSKYLSPILFVYYNII